MAGSHFFVGLIVVCFSGICVADWNDIEVPFEDANTPDVLFIQSDRSVTRIQFKEERTGDTKIAIMHYDDGGSDIGPEITKFDDGKTNEMLGAEAQKEGSVWYLVITKKQDYENVKERSYDFYYETGVGGQGHRVSLLIENINDMTPLITATQSECKIKENEIIGESSCTFTVIDEDGVVDKMVYTVTDSGAPSTLFSIVSLEATGDTAKIALSVASPGLDFEQFSLHILTISAKDDPVDGNTGSTSYVVQVIDEADTPPVWKTPIVPQTILEEEETTIQVTGADGDIGINAVIEYDIEFTDASDSEWFKIDSNGLISVGIIDRDVLTSDIFKFDVVAFEKDDRTSRIQSTMFVIIQDINDNEPVIDAAAFSISIPEETAMQLNLGIVITDPDLADFGQFKIELLDITGQSASANFLLIPTTGYQRADVTISVRNPAALDYENDDMKIITLQLVASEIADPSRKQMKEFIVTLLDVNDEFPEFDQLEYKKNMFENAKKGDVVITVKATDPDKGDTVKHSLTSQRSILAIDETTGEITVAADNAFDYERQIDIIVQVLAEDDVGHNTYVQLTITIDDVNDTPPNLEMPSTQPSVTENVDVGTTIEAKISASDVDLDAELTFDIAWLDSYATKQGARVLDETYKECIDIKVEYPDIGNTRNADAILSILEKKIDYESFDTLYLSIVVTDKKTDVQYPLSKTKSALLSIVIIDQNDNQPVFTLDSQNAIRSVTEGSKSSQLIGSVVATDADGPDYNVVRYSIKEDDPNLPKGLVMIDPEKGELRVDRNEAIDCDVDYKDKMQYIVTATDGTTPNTLKIVIDIIDLNDNPPQYDDTGFVLSIPENSVSGTPITVVSARDSDFSDPFKTISFFINSKFEPRLNDLFRLDENTGALTVQLNEDINAILDRDEGTTFYEIPIIFRDNYNQGSNSALSLFNDTKIILSLEDENDNAPEFPVITGCLASPLESTQAGEFIYNGLYAPDKDFGENASVTYSVLSYVRIADGFTVELPENMFEIETTSDFRGNIKVTTELTDLWGNYNLELRADDDGPDGTNMSSTAIYRICILDVNDNDPVIVYPLNGDVIRLREEQTIGGPLIDSKDKPLALFTATDADFEANADVVFRLTDTPTAMAYFELENNLDGQQNTAQLQLIKDLDPGTTLFQLTVSATDKGEPPRSSSVEITVVIVKVNDVEPEFQQRTWDVTFMENSESLSATLDPVAVDANNDHLTDPTSPEWNTIYYYIIDDGSVGFSRFELDKLSGVLTTKEPLDREDVSSYIFHVITTNNNNRPNTAVDEESLSQLILTVEVGDENDCPPVFDVDLWPGGISTDDKNGQVILSVNAVDPDLNDVVTYRLLQDTMEADPSLDLIKDNAFQLIPSSGELRLNFDPDSKMSGYFQFQVEASDKLGGEGHMGNASVKIFIIADSNRVSFKFLNDKSQIDAQKISVSRVFTEVIGFDCAIDSVVRATDETGIIIEDETLVTTHFIDGVENRPVDSSEITAIVNNRDKMTEMKKAFFNLEPYPLELADYNAGSTVDPKSLESLLRIILIVVSVVLGTLVILLFAAFFIKTRSLNRRLEALSTTKFGSQDSGLNRGGMNVPGANKHAIEGSNPVWNEDFGTKDLDNISQGSNDSDLIGIELNPEFNTKSSPQGGNVNTGYSPDAGRQVTTPTPTPHLENAPRRQSINPMSNGSIRGLSHQLSIDSDDNDEGSYPGANSNFSFAKKVDDIPITDL